MKKVIAIIKPYKLDDVKVALAKLNIVGMTLSEVKGYGQQKGHTELYRGAEYNIDFVEKIKLEIVTPDSKVDDLLYAIEESAKTGKIGDGKLFVYEIQEVIRIRTGDQGDPAI